MNRDLLCCQMALCVSVADYAGRGLTAKATAEEIGQFDEEGAAIAAKSGLELPGEWIETIPGQIVNVSNINAVPGLGVQPNRNWPRAFAASVS